MKEVKLYECELCGSTYKSEEECAACEKKHSKPVKIRNCRWNTHEMGNQDLPVEISIEFENGLAYWYRRIL